MHQRIDLAAGLINGHDRIIVELIHRPTRRRSWQSTGLSRQPSAQSTGSPPSPPRWPGCSLRLPPPWHGGKPTVSNCKEHKAPSAFGSGRLHWCGVGRCRPAITTLNRSKAPPVGGSYLCPGGTISAWGDHGYIPHSRAVLSTRRRGAGLPRGGSPGLNVREVSTGLHLPAG
jgi:hypothetical protein